MLLPCPTCGRPLERVEASRDGGVIAEPMWWFRGGRQVLRWETRPGTFYACSNCEWCGEQPPERGRR